MSELLKQYRTNTAPKLMEMYGLDSPMAVPRVMKVVLSMGVGAGSKDAKVMEAACEDLTKISGQKPVIRRAKKSVAGFNIREGQPVGCTVTLRGRRMFEFLERLIHVAIPRIRDFRGLSLKGFDGRGNYNLGLSEQTVFPEIPYDQVDALRGLCVTIVISGDSDEMSEQLLRSLGMPFVASNAN